MTFLEKLDWLMGQKGLNKHTLAQESGVAYTTIVGLYERGLENARISTVNKLCSYFGVSMDYLVLDAYSKPEDFTPNGKVAAVACEDGKEIELLQAYRSMNQENKSFVLALVKKLAGNPETQEGLTTKKEIS